MRIRDWIEQVDARLVAGGSGLEREIRGGYCGDLLSDVMANAGEGVLWLTIQSHKNIVGVAVLKELAGIVLANGRMPDEDTKAKADEEGIPILVTPRTAYETAGLLFAAGIGRTEE